MKKCLLQSDSVGAKFTSLSEDSEIKTRDRKPNTDITGCNVDMKISGVWEDNTNCK